MATFTEEIRAGWLENMRERVGIANDRINELLTEIESKDPGVSVSLNKTRIKDWQKSRAKYSDFIDAIRVKPVGSRITPSEFFFAAFGDSKNFMTPDVVTKGVLGGNVFYEIAAGTDFEHKQIAGVSIEVLEADGKINRDDERSKLFHGPYPIDQCRDYIKDLRAAEKQTTLPVGEE